MKSFEDDAQLGESFSLGQPRRSTLTRALLCSRQRCFGPEPERASYGREFGREEVRRKDTKRGTCTWRRLSGSWPHARPFVFARETTEDCGNTQMDSAFSVPSDLWGVSTEGHVQIGKSAMCEEFFSPFLIESRASAGAIFSGRR